MIKSSGIMRMFLLTGLFFLHVIQVFPQGDLDTLLRIRKAALENYRLINDTMTVRTWVNMRNYSRSLEKVVAADHLIIDSIMPGILGRLDLSVERSAMLEKQLSEEKQALEVSHGEIKNLQILYNFLFYIGGIIAVLFLIFFILTLIYIFRYRTTARRGLDHERQLKALEKQLDEYRQSIETLTLSRERLSGELQSGYGTGQGTVSEKEALEKELKEVRSALERETQVRLRIEEELKQLLEQLKG
jgi:hypothetical protein